MLSARPPRRGDSPVTFQLIVESKILTAKADVESAKLMKQTADILSSKAAMQIRYLETMRSIANSNGVKIVLIGEEEDS
jgi:erythrocyte band 7 integral membrane protein